MSSNYYYFLLPIHFTSPSWSEALLHYHCVRMAKIQPPPRYWKIPTKTTKSVLCLATGWWKWIYKYHRLLYLHSFPWGFQVISHRQGLISETRFSIKCLFPKRWLFQINRILDLEGASEITQSSFNRPGNQRRWGSGIGPRSHGEQVGNLWTPRLVLSLLSWYCFWWGKITKTDQGCYLYFINFTLPILEHASRVNHF